MVRNDSPAIRRFERMLYNSVMPFLHIVVLAVVQGLTELLPVSSSAHAVVAEKLLGLDPSSPPMMLQRLIWASPSPKSEMKNISSCAWPENRIIDHVAIGKHLATREHLFPTSAFLDPEDRVPG